MCAAGAEPVGMGWREIVAAALVAGDMSVDGIVRATAVSRDDAAEALSEAAAAGLVIRCDQPGAVVDAPGPDVEGSVGDGLSPSAALRLVRSDPHRILEVLETARVAPVGARSEFARLAASAGRLALAAGDLAVAESQLRVATELMDPSSVDRASLLLDLSTIAAASGRVSESRDLLSDVVALAETVGDVDLVVDAAVRSAFPPDWRAGDRRTAALLDLAERLDVAGTRSAAILAARAVVEMRLPISSDPDQQIAWVTRASVAQPLAERALSSASGDDHDRLLALVGWRSTHRSPRFLQRRLLHSAEAVDLAQRLLDNDRLADATVSSVVDALEAGDGVAHRRAVATMSWMARSHENPRVLWWAETVSAGAALLGGDVEGAVRHRRRAAEIGERHQLPGWVAAEIMIAAETALAARDHEEMAGYMVPSDTPILESPIARSTVALVSALLGDHRRSRQESLEVQRWLDEESSYLLCVTLLANAAAVVGDQERAAELLPLLEPWVDHVAVDAGGWWCNGPVDLAIAELLVVLGDAAGATAHLDAGEAMARGLGDVQSLRRSELVRHRLERSSRTQLKATTVPGLEGLSPREVAVLGLIARGWTNAAIGSELSYSASTIRADTVSIYRKLGVKGRPEAAAVAESVGLTARDG